MTDRDFCTAGIAEVRRLADAINQRGQHAAIFGDRGVGKSSLANVSASKLTASIPIVAPIINCNTTHDFKSIWRSVLSNIDLIQKRRTSGFQNYTFFEEMRSAAEVFGDGITTDELRRLFTLIEMARS